MSREGMCQFCGADLGKYDINTSINECPNCRSKNLLHKLFVEDELKIRESIKGSIKQKGIKKPRKEFFYGDEKSKANDIWVEKERVIDKETRRVLRECEEPLSKHVGYGSAKFKKDESN